MTLSKSFACLASLCAILLSAQDTPKTIALTDKSNVAASDIGKKLQKECPNASITSDVGKSDYTLEAIKKRVHSGLGITGNDKFDLTLFDRDGNTFSSTSDASLSQTLKDTCRAIKTSVVVEVVDTNTLTQSVDVRGQGPVPEPWLPL